MTVPALNKDSAKLVHFYHLAEHVYQPQTEPLPVSFVPPNAYWTSADKTAFFQSLARHSRWRPDLISDEIGGGKSVADVCSYIELLEQGLRDAPNTSRSRNTLPIAREVSDDWLRAEETMAEMLQTEEGEWQKYAVKRKRAEEVRLTKRSFRAGKNGDAQEDDDAAITPDLDAQGSDAEEGSWQERLQKRKQDFAAVWKREDLLSSLNGKYLKAMEDMVRNLEEEEIEGEHENSTKVRPTPLSDSVSRTLAPIPPDSTHLGTVPHPVPINSAAVDNSHIDPALIALDLQFRANPGTQPPAHDAPIAQFVEYPYNADPGPSNLHAHSRPFPSSAHRTSHDDSDSPDPLDLPFNLSPTSKRRIRKRLWMRRKRALQSGLSVSEVPTDVRKLKPGRKQKVNDSKGKGKEKPSEASESLNPSSHKGQPDALQDEDEDDDTDGSEPVKKHKSHGWAKLESVAVDGKFLRTAGLDLFSLRNFTGFTSLINDVYRRSANTDDSDEEGQAPMFSYTFLLLLRAHLTYFITRLIGRILTEKRIEAQQKKRVRSYAPQARRSLKIKVKNVHETLSIMGYSSTKCQFFRRLKNRIRETNTGDRENSSAASSSESSSDGSGPEPDDSAMSDDQDGEDHLDPTKQRSLPRGLIPQSEFHRIWSFMGDSGEGTQVLGDVDEDAVMRELAAENAVDKLDRDADRELEDSLWEEIGVQRYIQVEVVEAEPEPPVANVPAAKPRGAKSIRFRKPGGTIKSQVFIEDSDEDGWSSPEQ